MQKKLSHNKNHLFWTELQFTNIKFWVERRGCFPKYNIVFWDHYQKYEFCDQDKQTFKKSRFCTKYSLWVSPFSKFVHCENVLCFTDFVSILFYAAYSTVFSYSMTFQIVFNYTCMSSLIIFILIRDKDFRYIENLKC